MALLSEIKESGIKQFFNSLSLSERNVLEELAKGHNNPAIASRLCVVIKTVERHMTTMRQKYWVCTGVNLELASIRVLMANAYWKLTLKEWMK